MDEARSDRFDAAAGIAAVVLVIAGALIPGEPPLLTDEIGEVREFLTDKRDDIQAGAFIGGLSAVPFLWFLGALRAHLRRFEVGPGGLSAVAFGAGLVLLALVLVGNGLLVAATLHTDELGDAGVRALYDAQGYVFTMTAFPVAALIAATSASGLRNLSLPRSLGFGGAAIAAAEIIAALTLYGEDDSFLSIGGAGGVVAFLLFLAWVVGTSIVLMRGSRAVAEDASAEAR